MKKLALFGQNISQSLSPKVYKILSKKLSLNLTYEIIEPEVFSKNIVKKFDGFNVTTPFKKKAYHTLLPTPLDKASKETQTSNLYHRTKTSLNAYNSDFYGIKKSFQEKSIVLKGKKVTILGASDVSLTIIHFLKTQNIHSFDIYTRRHLKTFPEKLNALKMLKNSGDIFINTISEKFLESIIKDLDFTQSIVFDLNYYLNKSSLLKRKSLVKVDGLSMLIWQAIMNVEVWFSKEIKDKGSLKNEVYEEIKMNLEQNVKF